MAKIHKQVTIHASIDKVFTYMTNPRNLPEIWPSMVEVKNVKSRAEGGYNFDWVYKMGGMRFDGASDTIEFLHNKRQVTKSTKGIESKFTWDYETVMDGTQLTLEIEYKVPIPLIGKFAEAFLTKQNDHEADLLLENLKDKMEIETRVPA
jgi:uncharacterized protein YndB with AHSA1/START domain